MNLVNPYSYAVAGVPTFYYAEGWSATPGATGSAELVENGYTYLSKVVISTGGTVTKLGVWTSFVNFSSTVEMALFDSSRNYISGATASTTFASGDDQWHDLTLSHGGLTSGTYYIGLTGNTSSAFQQRANAGASGDGYISYSSGQAAFPASVTSLEILSSNWAYRVEISP